MSTANKPRQRFKVGDWVSLDYGPRRVYSRVIEDRGPIGVNQRRLYRIRLFEGSEDIDFEMPADDLDPAPALDKAAILRYLKEGGLVAMLRSNLTGDPNPPRVWLSYSPRGEVIHTFAAERGLIGGEAAPFFALLVDKVYRPKTEEVIEFLSSFGLSREEAEEVVRAVGTAP
jgi:hypothetical protein